MSSASFLLLLVVVADEDPAVEGTDGPMVLVPCLGVGAVMLCIGELWVWYAVAQNNGVFL